MPSPQPKEPSKEPIKVLFRKYPDGEVIALMPEEPGCPRGHLAVAYGASGGHYPVEPVVVMGNTVEAAQSEAFRVRKALLADHPDDVLDVGSDLADDHLDTRIDKRGSHHRFPNLRQMYLSLTQEENDEMLIQHGPSRLDVLSQPTPVDQAPVEDQT